MPIKHRHFLGIPVFLLLVGMTMASVGSELRGDIGASVPSVAGEITARGSDRAFSLPRGISGLLHEDGILSDDGAELTLREGTALVTSDGMISVRAGNLLIAGFHGSFLVSTTGQKLSVLALTMPVLLQRDGFRLIIPAGMQGEWAVDALPSAFDLAGVAAERERLRMIDAGVAREQLQALRQLDPVALPSLDDGALFWLPWMPFVLPLAEQRMADDADRMRLSRLREVLASGDAAQARLQLEDDDVRRILQSELPETVFPILLSSAAAVPSAAQELLTETQDIPLWLLASFHPAFVSAAWETPGPISMPQEPRMLRWLQLPSSDVGTAFPARAVDRWESQVQQYLENAEPADRAGMLSALLMTLNDYRVFVEKSEYPERLHRYAGALQRLISPFASELSPRDRDLYAAWKNIDAIGPYSEPPPAPVASPVQDAPVLHDEQPAASEEPFDAAAVEAQVKQQLLGAGALFTIQTEIHAESAARVLVSKLIFASSSGESQYRFVLDPTTNTVSAIERDGALQPYPLTLEAVGRWARGK